MTTFLSNTISFEIADVLSSAETPNGGVVIRIPRTGSTVIGHNADGAALNVPGFNTNADLDRGVLTDPTVRPGDSLLLWRASDGGQWVTDWPEDGSTSSSRNHYCVPVVFVDFDPTEDQLCPPAVGRASNELVRFGRSAPITTANIKLDRMPRDFKLSEWTDQENSPLTPELLAESCRPFAGEFVSGAWGTAGFTPGVGNGLYGRNVAAWTSKQLLFLCSDATDEEKMPVAVGVCQRGLSLAGAYMDGKQDLANGGHFQGRTPLMIAAGVMLGIGPMADPRWLGPRFWERHAFYEDGRSWWFDDEWTSLWQRTSDYRWGGAPAALDRRPQEWSTGHGGDRWAVEGYYAPTCGANLGTAIAMRLMNKEHAVGSAFVRGVLDQWMVGPPAAARQQLADAGMVLPWVEEWPKPWNGLGVQRQAFDQLRGRGLI